MLEGFSPSDFVVAQEFRWRGLVYTVGSGLPTGMPPGAMTQFLRTDPPLIERKNGETKTVQAETTKKRTAKKKKKKASKKKKVKKRVAT